MWSTPYLRLYHILFGDNYIRRTYKMTGQEKAQRLEEIDSDIAEITSKIDRLMDEKDDLSQLRNHIEEEPIT